MLSKIVVVDVGMRGAVVAITKRGLVGVWQ